MSGTFEELEVWKKACRLAVRIHTLLKDCRDFGMKDQMFRAAVSIASNIAEGSERKSIADFKRFIYLAKGSAAELRTQTYISGISGSIGILKQAEMESYSPNWRQYRKCIRVLQRHLNTSLSPRIDRNKSECIFCIFNSQLSTLNRRPVDHDFGSCFRQKDLRWTAIWFLGMSCVGFGTPCF